MSIKTIIMKMKLSLLSIPNLQVTETCGRSALQGKMQTHGYSLSAFGNRRNYKRMNPDKSRYTSKICSRELTEIQRFNIICHFLPLPVFLLS